MTLHARQKTVLIAISAFIAGGLLAKFAVIPAFFR